MPYKPTRATKSRNILLQKVIVGKGKTSTYDLPPADHVYGQAVFRDPLDDFVIQGSQPKETKIVRRVKKLVLPSDKDPQYTYGKPSRSILPVEEAPVKLQNGQQNQSKAKKAIKEKLANYALPKPRIVKEVEDKPLFKMSKFKKVGPVVKTHRDASIKPKSVATAAI